MKCFDICQKENKLCQNKECRLWINFGEDLNCVLIAVKNNGPMKLEDIGKRLEVTAPRIKQIEKSTLNKINTNAVSLKVIQELFILD